MTPFMDSFPRRDVKSHKETTNAKTPRHQGNKKLITPRPKKILPFLASWRLRVGFGFSFNQSEKFQ